MAFIVKPLEIFWQNFNRKVPWIVLYQADDSSALGKNSCPNYNSLMVWNISIEALKYT